MKTSLDVKGRIMILNLLPQEGNIVTIRMFRDLAEKVGLTAEEHTEFQVRQDVPGQVQWNEKGNEPKEFEFADAEVEIIKAELIKRNEKNQLTADMIPIYDKFFT
jgi:hypothetical protein